MEITVISYTLNKHLILGKKGTEKCTEGTVLAIVALIVTGRESQTPNSV